MTKKTQDLKSTLPERWNDEQIDDLTGKTAIVTGANSGLGFETARILAQKGASVILASRDAAKVKAAMQTIKATAPAAQLEHIALDLADLGSVRVFAQTFSARHVRLDILCNNAGVMALPQSKTKDGFEMQIGTNHLGHFALTAQLLPVIEKTPGARIVTTSSGFHWLGRIRFDNLNSEKSYSRWGAYCQSKLANLLFAFELQRRLQHANISAFSFAAHPGYAATNLQFVGANMESTALARVAGLWVMKFSNAVFAQSALMGALPILCAATAAGVRGGDFIGPKFELRGHPSRSPAASWAHDQNTAKQLWEKSEELVGLRFLSR